MFTNNLRLLERRWILNAMWLQQDAARCLRPKEGSCNKNALPYWSLLLSQTSPPYATDVLTYLILEFKTLLRDAHSLFYFLLACSCYLKFLHAHLLIYLFFLCLEFESLCLASALYMSFLHSNIRTYAGHKRAGDQHFDKPAKIWNFHRTRISRIHQ